MKKLLTVLLVCFGLTTYGQTTINPDTVCANATGEQYFVTNTPTSTYQWTITGGGGVLKQIVQVFGQCLKGRIILSCRE